MKCDTTIVVRPVHVRPTLDSTAESTVSEPRVMAPANTLDWSEPCQQWRYPKICPTSQKSERTKNAVELSGKEANSAYKKFCKFLRRLGNKKRKSNPSKVAPFRVLPAAEADDPLDSLLVRQNRRERRDYTV